MPKSFYEQKCRICGCDWNHACNDHDYWFAEDLCSACAEEMKPILFNTPMVQGILQNRKTNTRRVVKRKGYDDKIHDSINDFAQNFCGDLWEFGQRWENRIAPQHAIGVHSPFLPGDILYVRETWCERLGDISRGQYIYKAHAEPLDEIHQYALDQNKWRPSIHMPREAARIFLRVVGTRPERLRDITEDGAKAEGLVSTAKPTPDGLDYAGLMAYDQFSALWNSIYSAPQPVKDHGVITHYESYPWDDIQETRTYKGLPWLVYGNPWVWTVSFQQI